VSGARRLGGREVVRDHLAAQRLVRTAPSLATPIWVATSVVLMLAFAPAVASGKSVNRSGRVPATRTAHGASQIAVAHNKQELLAFGSGYPAAHGSSAVRDLQRRLTGLGYAPGAIDGRYGPLTEQAVRRFQAAHGLIVDGIDGPVTRSALASARLILRPGDGYVPGGSAPVRALQRRLARAGFSAGPIDGRYGPLTERAVRRLQAARHLAVDGVAGPRTFAQLGRAPRRPVEHRPGPGSGAHPRPSPPRTRPPRPLTHRTRPASGHPGGASAVPWLIVLACLALATLTGLVWQGRRRRDGRLAAASAGSGSHGEPVSDPAAEPGPQRAHARPDLRPTDDPGAGAEVFRLAHVLAETGKRAPALDALDRADRLGHPGAALELGLLLAEQGDLAGARDALLRADQRGHPEAAFELGALLERHGDTANAAQAYRLGDKRGHAGAAFGLGVLLLRGGDVAGATEAFRRADERGHPGAATNLGVLLEQRGDLAGGRAAYERADRRGEAVGAYNLGLVLEQEGERERAKAAFRRAEERGESAATLRLGRLLEEEGDREGARRAFQRAGQVGPPEVAEFAHAALRELHTDPKSRDRRGAD
jgi:peptidoglycan hydrolase-like protein with peptidoglycan-binding domain/tetratricopeptide (TPR) repeat protein